MDSELLNQLLEETIVIAIEEKATESSEKFVEFVKDMLPEHVISALEDINGDDSFLLEIWNDKFERIPDVTEDASELLADGQCEICERFVRLTRHHVYPREVHKSYRKKGHDVDLLNTTIAICRMCHSTIHRFFTNEELAARYHSVTLLLSDERFFRYARWASAQSNNRYKGSL